MTQVYNTETIKAKAGEISAQNNELRKIIAQMESIIHDMSNVWKDNAQTKFVQQFNELKPDLDSFCKSIDSFAERAETHANDVIKVEPIL